MSDKFNPEEIKEAITEKAEEAEAENPYAYVIRHPAKTYEAIKEDSKEFDRNGGYTAEEFEREKSRIDINIQKFEQDNKRIDGEIVGVKGKITDIREAIRRKKGNRENTDALETELHKLEKQLDELESQKESNGEHLERLHEKAEEISDKIKELKSGTSRIATAVKRAAKKVAKSPFNAAKKAVKSAESKVNPFNKPINKSDTTDTGVESIRLADKTVKTITRNVKTTKRTIKTAGNTVKTTGKVIYKTGEFTVKAAAKTIRFTGAVVTHAAAIAINPIFLVIVGIVIIGYTFSTSLLLILAADNTQKEAMTSAAGLVNVEEQYSDGVSYFNAAYDELHDRYNDLIDSLYFNNDDLTHSDLVYLERRHSDVHDYTAPTGFATDDYKNILKSAWDLSLDESEFIAIVYVYLEKIQNESHSTELEIYEITFTQDVFNDMMDKFATYSENIYGGQRCPDEVCTAHYYDNPDYSAAWDKVNVSVNAYNEWVDFLELFDTYNGIHDGAAQAAYWENNIGWRIDNWCLVYSYLYGTPPYYSNSGRDYLSYLGNQYVSYVNIANNTPQYIIEHGCDVQHNLHSVDLRFFSKEDVIEALGFTNAEIQWIDLTVQGFEANPNI